MTLEDLLNTLIQRGWKPFGDIDIAEFNQIENTFVAINYESKVIGQPKLRQIASKESGLWQFVCENNMEKKMEKINRGIWINSWHKDAYESYPVYTMEKYEYWILESALCDEDKLESFILDNIKIDE